MDRSGLVIFAYGLDFKQFVVKEVLENSPAKEAGIQSEDIILRIQGLPTRFYNLDSVNAMLQKKEGKRIKMALKRGDQVIQAEFLLRDLI